MLTLRLLLAIFVIYCGIWLMQEPFTLPNLIAGVLFFLFGLGYAIIILSREGTGFKEW